MIYTCDERWFRKEPPYDEKGGSHFDTNHHVTVLWNENEPERAAQELKDTIRATLPEDAKQTDD